MNAHQLAAFGEADVTEDELRTWLTSPSVEAERDIRVLEQDRPARRLRRRRSRTSPTRRPGGATSRSRPTPTRMRLRLSWSAGSRIAPTRARCACGRRRRMLGWSPPSSGSASRPSGTPTGWRSTSTKRRLSLSGRHGISVRTLADGEERRIYERIHGGLAGHLRPTRRVVRGVGPLADAGGVLRALAVVPRVEQRRARRVLRSAGRTATIQLRDTSGCSASGDPGAGRASATRCSCSRCRRSGSEGGREARSESTPRARPERRGCTSGPGCASTATRSFSSGPLTDRVRPCRAFAPAARTAGR